MTNAPPPPALETPRPAEAAGHPPWDANLDTASDMEFASVWLQRQCTAVPGTRAGVILLSTMAGLVPAATWPSAQPLPPELTRIADRAKTATQAVIVWERRPAERNRLDLLIGLGIRLHGTLAAVIAIALDVGDGMESTNPDALAEQLHMGCGWLDARMSRRQMAGTASKMERAAVAMDIIAVASAHRRPAQSAAAVINELAARLRCTRVSLGLVRRGRIRLKALSHSASFQERGRIVDAIENAMEECAAQATPIAWPPPPALTGRIHLAHRDLVGLHAGPASCASVVLAGPDGPTGVLTFERHNEATPFDFETLRLAEAVGALLGPVLRVQVVIDRLVSGRLLDGTRDGIRALTGTEKPSLKLAVVAACLALGVLIFAKAEYRVTARAVLEGEVQRAAVAPFDGFIAASSVRPGDHLRAGDLLALMDDRDLSLERARAWAEAEKLLQKYDEALAKHDRPNTAMLAAQVDQAEAQLALAEEKLRRSRIVSPIDGLLVSGDLSQMLGSPVERGKTLFEIAPLDEYRVVLRADERDLRYLARGQAGLVSLAGAPDDRRSFTLTRITPIAEAKDGRNEFRIEGRLDAAPGPGLQPGMEGVAKVATGTHRMLWVWTHSLVDWLRQTAWKWSP